MLISQRAIVYSPQLASRDFSHMENHHVFSKRRAFLSSKQMGHLYQLDHPFFVGKKHIFQPPGPRPTAWLRGRHLCPQQAGGKYRQAR
jgi:hypothetical protein